MTADKMRERAQVRNELRKMLAAFRYDHSLESYPSLMAKRRASEEPWAKHVIFCGKDEAESEAIATDLINSRAFRQLASRDNVSYTRTVNGSPKGWRTTIEIIVF